MNKLKTLIKNADRCTKVASYMKHRCAIITLKPYKTSGCLSSHAEVPILQLSSNNSE